MRSIIVDSCVDGTRHYLPSACLDSWTQPWSDRWERRYSETCPPVTTEVNSSSGLRLDSAEEFRVPQPRRPGTAILEQIHRKHTFIDRKCGNEDKYCESLSLESTVSAMCSTSQATAHKI
jgi:hypothetical protein